MRKTTLPHNPSKSQKPPIPSPPTRQYKIQASSHVLLLHTLPERPMSLPSTPHIDTTSTAMAVSPHFFLSVQLCPPGAFNVFSCNHLSTLLSPPQHPPSSPITIMIMSNMFYNYFFFWWWIFIFQFKLITATTYTCAMCISSSHITHISFLLHNYDRGDYDDDDDDEWKAHDDDNTPILSTPLTKRQKTLCLCIWLPIFVLLIKILFLFILFVNVYGKVEKRKKGIFSPPPHLQQNFPKKHDKKTIFTEPFHFSLFWPSKHPQAITQSNPHFWNCQVNKHFQSKKRKQTFAFVLFFL